MHIYAYMYIYGERDREERQFSTFRKENKVNKR